MRLKTGPRLVLSFGAVLAIMTLVTALAVWRLHTVDGIARYLVQDKLATQQLVADWLGKVRLNSVRANAIAKSDSLEVGQYFEEQLAAGDKEIESLQKKAAAAAGDAREASLLAEVERHRKDYMAVRDLVFQLKAVGKTIEVEQLVATRLAASFKAYDAAIQAMLDDQKSQAQAVALESNKVYRTSVFLLVALGAVAVVAGTVLAWLLTRSIVKPLHQAVRIASQVASGDLGAVIATNRDDEIGELLNALRSMNASLALTVLEVRDGVHEIDDALRELAIDNAKLSDRTSAQAQALQQISASMDEMTVTVKQTAENARRANHLAVSASEVAAQGGTVAADVAQTMHSINASSRHIADIIGVIDDIAFQTNILALNAAVEAARAGEHGRGFAVVASEVRTLAQRSATAAKQIKTLITASVGNVEMGSKLVQEAGTTMENIVGSVQRVTDIMGQIDLASEAQSHGLHEINHAIEQIDRMTQQNACLVHDAVAASHALQQHAERVARSVSIFRADDCGKPDEQMRQPRLAVVAPSILGYSPQSLVVDETESAPRELFA